MLESSLRLILRAAFNRKGWNSTNPASSENETESNARNEMILLWKKNLIGFLTARRFCSDFFFFFFSTETNFFLVRCLRWSPAWGRRRTSGTSSRRWRRTPCPSSSLSVRAGRLCCLWAAGGSWSWCCIWMEPWSALANESGLKMRGEKKRESHSWV